MNTWGAGDLDAILRVWMSHRGSLCVCSFLSSVSRGPTPTRGLSSPSWPLRRPRRPHVDFFVRSVYRAWHVDGGVCDRECVSISFVALEVPVRRRLAWPRNPHVDFLRPGCGVSSQVCSPDPLAFLIQGVLMHGPFAIVLFASLVSAR